MLVMLNSPSVERSNKINECIMRRRARNLRAKVKALLPVQICCKHNQRNRCVCQIQKNKVQWDGLHTKRNWCMNQQNQLSAINNFSRFQKLTKAQIQQIKQDKLYYLGQENLQDFQQFLKGKNKFNKQGTKSLQNESLCRLIKNQPCNTVNQRNSNRLSEQFNSFRTQNKQLQQLINKKNTIDKHILISQRKKAIQAEQKLKRVENKVKLNLRMQRAENKLIQILKRKTANFHIRNNENKENIEKLTNRRRNYLKCGQIKQIEQQLRKTLICRKSKTANQFTRPSKSKDPYTFSHS